MKTEDTRFAFAHIPIYPVLIAIYPILSLLAYNLGEIRPIAAARPLVAALVLAIIVLWALWRLFRDLHRAAFVAGIWLFLFFIYGHVRIALFKADWTRPAVLVPIWLVVALLALLAGRRVKMRFRSLSLIANVIWAVCVGLSVFQMIAYQAKSDRLLEAARQRATPVDVSAAEPASLPDVYLFILDSYARADTLQAVYGFDNSEFLGQLEDLGFYVASCSQSNFDRTELSLASMLNLEYLQALHPELTGRMRESRPLWALIQHSRVRATLEDLGYETVAFATGYPWTEWRDADLYIQPDVPFGALSEFEVLALRTTFMNALQELGLVDFQSQEYERYRERTLLLLDRLPDVAAEPGPQFYFVHILEPHPPFIFNADGTFADAGQYVNHRGEFEYDDYARGYINEVQFINGAVLEQVRGILRASDPPPVIIMMGDHGPWLQSSRYTMPNLNAYYMPDHDSALYPQITPVNSFRLVFDEYLGAELPLYEDRSYDSPTTEPYNYAQVPNECP